MYLVPASVAGIFILHQDPKYFTLFVAILVFVS